MEFWDQFGLCLLQETAQRLGKQLVVAIPSSLVIERDHEEIGVLKPLQHYLPVRQFSHRIGEGSIHAIEDAGVQEKGLHCGRLLGEDFLAQVVKHEAVAAAEGGEELRDIGPPLQRERGQLDSGNPTLRALL